MAKCIDDAHVSCNKEVIYKSGKSDTRTYILLTARASSRVCCYRRMQGEQLAKAKRETGERARSLRRLVAKLTLSPKQLSLHWMPFNCGSKQIISTDVNQKIIPSFFYRKT